MLKTQGVSLLTAAAAAIMALLLLPLTNTLTPLDLEIVISLRVLERIAAKVITQRIHRTITMQHSNIFNSMCCNSNNNNNNNSNSSNHHRRIKWVRLRVINSIIIIHKAVEITTTIIAVVISHIINNSNNNNNSCRCNSSSSNYTYNNSNSNNNNLKCNLVVWAMVVMSDSLPWMLRKAENERRYLIQFCFKFNSTFAACQELSIFFLTEIYKYTL